MQRIGEKLKTLRLRQGLTTRQLADYLQTTNSQISRIENGLRQPSADFIVKVIGDNLRKCPKSQIG
ncbi:MAG: hypothetical protein DPW09_42895 [Anaerolineae bacterium]|nr:helix-turn-helix transcriptional regulator [Anaerolineales bacterium]MCQ3980210.1 hypothetical protein [Anaerolineae bacterium]